MSLREGDRVLVPDREHAYLPATVVQRTEAGLDVRLVDGSTHTLAAAAASQVVLADPLAFQGSDDMVRFNLLTEASIVHNLRVRYEREAIYTAVGPILISVNPLRQLEGLFGPEVAQRYADAADGAALSALPPHPYAQVEAAYREVLSQGCNQSLVVSGESGAGHPPRSTTQRCPTGQPRPSPRSSSVLLFWGAGALTLGVGAGASSTNCVAVATASGFFACCDM